MLRHTLLKALPFRSFFTKPALVANSSLTQTPVRCFWSNILKLAADASKDVGVSAESSAKMTNMKNQLNQELAAEHITIEDVSGGCGAFFKMLIVSDAFLGKSLIARHRFVQNILKNEIKDMHGITLNTITVDQYKAQVANAANK